MTDKEIDGIEDLKIDVEEETTEEDSAPELTPAEAKAMDDGWRPEEEWEGEAADFVGAKEFNFRGELMSKITSQSGKLLDQNKKVDELTKALKVLGEHQKKTAEVEHKRIMDALKKEKVMALDEDDNIAVVEIDEKMAELKESKREVAEEKELIKEVEKETPKEIDSWFKDPKNDWYHKDPILQAVANSISNKYIDMHGEGDLNAMLKFVEQEVRKEMPHRFSDTPTRVGRVTETTDGHKGKSKKFTKKDLDEDQLEVAKTFVDMGVYKNVQEFVNELVKNGDLN